MRKIISFMHISLDGFVAGPNGEMNWIKADEELFAHIGKRIDACDTSMYGRNTYEMMEGYWPEAGNEPDASAHDKQHSAWYTQVQKVVLSRSLENERRANTTFIGSDLQQRINDLKQQPGSEILLFGSPTATHALLEQNLIDGFWLFVNPILLGAGIPLFQGIKERTKLQRTASQAFPNGVTELSYTIDRS